MTETDLKFGIPDIALPKAGGGFVPQAAAGIAGVGEPAVNLAALAGGKWVDAKTVATAGSAATGDRDK